MSYFSVLKMFGYSRRNCNPQFLLIKRALPYCY